MIPAQETSELPASAESCSGSAPATSGTLFILCLETGEYPCFSGFSPAFRRQHEDNSVRSNCGQRFAACGRRVRPGKEDQAVGPSARRRKDGGSPECGSNHSRIFDGKTKG